MPVVDPDAGGGPATRSEGSIYVPFEPADVTRRIDGGSGGRVSFRALALATAGLVYATVLLGVATKATGSGLACNASWPLCDGGFLNLLPATVPSFFEWIHRVVAGVTGLAILWTAVAAWRRPGVGPTARRGAVLGLVLLPVQVLLGRETVLQFTTPVLAAHYWTATAIFGGFAVATIDAWRPALGRAHATRALAAAVVLLPVQVAVGPAVVAAYTPPLQAVHYAATLLAFAAVLLAAMVGWRTATRPVRYALGLSVVLLPVLVLLGRNVLSAATRWLLPAYDAVAVLLLLSLLAATVGFRRSVPPRTATA